MKHSRACIVVALSGLLAGVGVLALPAAAAEPEVVEPGVSPEMHEEVLAGLGLRRCRVERVGIAPSLERPFGLSVRVPLDLTGTGAATPAVLELEPYAVRAPDFGMTVVGEDGVERRVEPPAPSTYRGVEPVTGAEVWASVVDGRVRATILPADGRAPVYVQSIAASLPELGAHPALHAVYSHGDVLPRALACGVEDGEHAPEAGIGVRGPGECRVVELIADTDYPFYRSNGFSAHAAATDVEATILGVNQLYAGSAFSPTVRFALKQIVVRAGANDAYSSLPEAETDPFALLNRVSDVWDDTTTVGRDMVHLFTARSIEGGTVGLAHTAAMCYANAAGLTESIGARSIPYRSATAAHELGHNFGMTHDASPGFIMAASTSVTAIPTLFSPQSLGAYAAKIPGFACLTNVPPDAAPDAARTLVGRSVLIDVLANDNAGSVCGSPVTSFTVPSTSSAGGSVTVSVGTGPGGRDQVSYTPPAGSAGLEDSFAYTANGITQVRVGVSVAAPRPAVFLDVTGAGLAARYYDIRNSNGSVRIDPEMRTYDAMTPYGTGVAATINYPPTSEAAAGSGRNFGVGAVFEGYLSVPATDLYRFWIVSDDMSRLTIGDVDARVVLDNPAVQTDAEASGEAALAAGWHPIRIDYTQYAGNSTLVLSYAGLGTNGNAGFSRQTVPGAALARGTPGAPPCPADFDGQNGVQVADIFAFLRAWFANSPSADFDQQNGIQVADIFSFLRAWFAGCP